MGDQYEVVLLFSEAFYSNVGDRLFDIGFEGSAIVTDFDIIDEAGGRGQAVKVTENFTASDSVLNITLTGSGGDEVPLIQGLTVRNVVIPEPTSFLLITCSAFGMLLYKQRKY